MVRSGFGVNHSIYYVARLWRASLSREGSVDLDKGASLPREGSVDLDLRLLS